MKQAMLAVLVCVALSGVATLSDVVQADVVQADVVQAFRPAAQADLKGRTTTVTTTVTPTATTTVTKDQTNDRFSGGIR